MPTPTKSSVPPSPPDRELAEAFTGCLGSAVRQADRLIASVFDERLRGLGLRGTQLSLLGAVAMHDRPSQRELAEATHADATTLSRNLDRLLERGLVVRADCCDDKRVRRYALTDAGRQLLVEALPHWQDAQREVADKLGVDLCDVLRRAAEAMARG